MIQETAYIALGSNLGDRAHYIYDGVRLLIERVGVRVRLSPLYETQPVGYLDQPAFLNGVAELWGKLPEPRELLATCLRIEEDLGRERTIEQGPRTLDLDLLLCGDCVSADDRLTLPHPRMHLRAFVLRPLVDLAPEARHPVLRASAKDLLRALEATEGRMSGTG